jgi:uncharacterized membrane protein (UPF0127 family)
VVCFLLPAVLWGCSETASFDSAAAERNDLGAMATARVTMAGQPFELWLAAAPDERRLGLMQVTEAELAPFSPDADDSASGPIERGMLFVFPFEQPLSFWMYNTITPLDIAFIRNDGVVVKTYTLAPLETRSYPSVEPVRFAIEVRAGLLGELGLEAGNRVELPESVLENVS